MNNLKVYLNNCRKEVLNEYQLCKEESEYKVGKTLYAASNVGKERLHQEDSVLILEHPSNKEVKLIAVADGLGGHGDGDLASNHVLKKLINWFENKNFENKNIRSVKKDLDDELIGVLGDLDSNPYAATTLSLALIKKNETLIANIGDSRIYSLTDNKLTQETRDDSLVQELYEENYIPTKELMRFHKFGNRLTQSIDKRPRIYHIKYKIILNNYDKLIALTDGISDCLSEKEIENILNTTKDSQIATTMVEKALETDSSLEETVKELSESKKIKAFGKNEMFKHDYFQEIKGGKDNATVAVYVRKK